MQTWLVHMREPRRLYQELASGFFAFQLLLGGALLAALVHPVFAGIMIVKAINGDIFHASAGNPYVTRDAMLLLVLAGGYLSAAALAAKGLHRRRVPISLWLFATIPVYWLLLSLAAWRALKELLIRPHHWAKTEHGKRAAGSAGEASRTG